MKRNRRKQSLGKRLKRAREKAGISINELHRRTGRSVSGISAIEKGSDPGVDTLRILCAAVGCDLVEIVTGKPSPVAELERYRGLLEEAALWHRGHCLLVETTYDEGYVKLDFDTEPEINLCEVMDVIPYALVTDDKVSLLAEFLPKEEEESKEGGKS